MGSNLAQIAKDFSLPGHGSVPIEQGDGGGMMCEGSQPYPLFRVYEL